MYDVYFGPSSPPPLVASDLTDAIYDPDTLEYLTTYYWKIVAEDEWGLTTTGPVWQFTTKDVNHPPYTPNSPDPTDGETDVSVNADLSWSGGDPDGDSVTYDVYFGTSFPPPLVSNDQSATAYDPGTLSEGTQYYWNIDAEDEHGATATGPVWWFTTEDDVAWTIITLQSSVETDSVDIVELTEGHPGVVYVGGSALKYIYSNGLEGTGSWSSPRTITSLSSSDSWHPSLAVISSYPAVTYNDFELLRYARAGDATGEGSWTVNSNQLADGYHDTSLGVVGGRPTFACCGFYGEQINYRRALNGTGSGSWDTLRIVSDTGSQDTYWSSDVGDFGGKPGIVYGDDDSGKIWFAYNSNVTGSGSWSKKEIKDGSSSMYGFFAKVINIGGKPLVAFLDISGGFRLKVAASSQADGQGSWSVNEVVNVGEEGSGIDLIAIDGKPVVVFYYQTQGKLYLATCSNSDGSGTWTPEEIDSGGRWPGIAEIDGRPAVAYLVGSTLKYAIKNN